MRKTNEILNAALYYAGLGWPVFPVNLDKTPATAHGFKDATTDQDIIKSWFTNSTYNLAVRTGKESGIIVIDIDGQTGRESLNNLTLIYGPLPSTVQQITGGGGIHFIFKYPGPGIKNKVNIAPGVDVRADGGYIVVAPSRHSSGNLYQWEPGHASGEIPLADLPPWWLSFLTGENEKSMAGPQSFQISGGIIPEGSRNRTLFELACSLRAKGLPESAIWAALTTTNEERCAPPLGSDELETTFKSAMRYEPGQIRIATSARNDFSTTPTAARVICLEDVIEVPVNWLWFPYIPLGKLTLVQGDPGLGKTFVTLSIAANITTGRPLPGNGQTEPGNVIYQTAEDGIGDTIKPRLRKAVADCRRVFVIDESEKGLSLSDERIETTLIQLRPKLLIVDPLQAYIGADIDFHKANQVRAVLKKIGFLAEKYQCAIIMTMHLSKAGYGNAIYRGLGSIDIPAAARSVLMFGKNPNNPSECVIAQSKNSLERKGDSLIYEITDFGVMWRGTSDLTAEDLGYSKKDDPGDDDEKKNPIHEARKYLIERLQDGPKLGKEILEGVKYAGFSTRTLNTAKAQLKIITTWEGRECYWSFPPDQEFPPDAKEEP